MKPLTNSLKEQIKTYIRNKIDINDLIKDVNIKGMDLSNAIITKFIMIDCDISDTNFSNSILGIDNDKDVFTMLRLKMNNCNFSGAKFIGKAFIRGCDARNCNFKNADVSKVQYEHTDFRNTPFCGAIMRLDSRTNIGCKFDRELIVELIKNWDNKNEIKER